MTAWLGEFHFLRPLWLLALLPAAALWWYLRRARAESNGWRRIIDGHLLPALLVDRGARTGDRPALTLLALAWLLATLALAGPTWDRQPQPVFQTFNSRVVVLDLSQSMAADDLKPSRLVRARFKVIDILNRSEDAQVGLIAFAGDAFVVAPITQDTATVRNLLPVLEPSLMPVQGSRIDRALALAGELLRQAELSNGSVILLSDGAASADDQQRALDAARALRDQGYRLSVLGIGTANGVPIVTDAGELLKDAAGAIVIPRLDTGALADLAAAGGGGYATIQADDGDLDTVLAEAAFDPLADEARQVEQETAAWQERGPWLVLALLPLAALAFRRGWLLTIGLTALLLPPLPPAARAQPPAADGVTLTEPRQLWQDLWLRRDQQALRALDSGDPRRATQLATDPWLRGTAAYRAGDYDLAERAFAQVPGASGAYNRGNALTQLERYQEAIAAYDAALRAQPDLTEAQDNRALAERLLRQQQQQNASANQDSDGAEQQPSSPQQQQQQTAEQDDNGSDNQSSEAGNSQPSSARANESQQAESDQSDPASDSSASDTAAAGDTRQQDQPQSNRGDEDSNDGRPPDQPPEQRQLAGDSDDALSDEERQALDHLLQRIPDDPGGLLRTKFLRQYQRRAIRPSPDAPNW